MKKYILFTFISCLALQAKSQTVTDADGNNYNTVTIGTQVWMKENLKTTRYNDGTTIPNVAGKAAWSQLSTHAYCWYNDTMSKYKSYGALYNGFTINSGKLCPEGWHIPSLADWDILFNYVDITINDSIRIRSIYDTSYGGTNTLGLTLKPTGIRFTSGDFAGIETWGGYWTTTINSTTQNYEMVNIDAPGYLYYNGEGSEDKEGLGVRCLRDESAALIITDITIDNFIYPNPVTEKLYINTNYKLNSRVIIIDLQGKQVLDAQTDGKPIDISNLARGIYLVKIMDSGNSFVKTIIKQ